MVYFTRPKPWIVYPTSGVLDCLPETIDHQSNVIASQTQIHLSENFAFAVGFLDSGKANKQATIIEWLCTICREEV